MDPWFRGPSARFRDALRLLSTRSPKPLLQFAVSKLRDVLDHVLPAQPASELRGRGASDAVADGTKAGHFSYPPGHVVTEPIMLLVVRNQEPLAASMATGCVSSGSTFELTGTHSELL